MSYYGKRAALVAVCVAAMALVLALLWHVPVVYTLIGFAAWAFVGHLLTADDERPGGWSNPTGSMPFPWFELGMKALVLGTLIFLAVCFPNIRAFGAG